MTILEQIVSQKREEVKKTKERVPQSELCARLEASKRSFKNALAGGRSRKAPYLIAELKHKSPSEGVIREQFHIEEIANIYTHYAQAISVVTDEPFFGGNLEYLERVARVSSLPLLRKDFIIDEYQIYESRRAGADAVLLIASILEEESIARFQEIAWRYDMSALVEVHDALELEKALRAEAEIIGINNRDLKTFYVAIAVTSALAPLVPKNKIIVSESGFHAYADIARVSGVADAVLIGTSLLRASNIEEKIKALFSAESNT